MIGFKYLNRTNDSQKSIKNLYLKIITLAIRANERSMRTFELKSMR